MPEVIYSYQNTIKNTTVSLLFKSYTLFAAVYIPHTGIWCMYMSKDLVALETEEILCVTCH